MPMNYYFINSLREYSLSYFDNKRNFTLSNRETKNMLNLKDSDGGKIGKEVDTTFFEKSCRWQLGLFTSCTKGQIPRTPFRDLILL